METMRLVIGLLSCFGVAHAEGKQCVVAQPVALAPAKVKAPHEQASGGVALPELDKVRARITGWDAREGAKSIEDAAAAYLAECK